MLIKSLRLKNFRQFKGDTNIEFSYDPEKNVTIILGDNTYGKTTLLQAFNWCFYKVVNFDHNPKFLLNYELNEEMANGTTSIVMVETVIIHDNIEYRIIRKQEYKKNNGKTVLTNDYPIEIWYKNEIGNLEILRDSPQSWINELLPKELSTYFFFDTERVNSISHKENVSEAVKGLLGLSTLAKTVEHLGSKNKKESVIGFFQQKLEMDNEQDSLKIEQDIQKNEFDLEKIKEQIKKSELNREEYKSKKEELDEIIHANADTKRMQEEEKRLEIEINNNEKNLEENKNEIFGCFYQLTNLFFKKPLIEKTLSCISNLDLKDDRIAGLSERILKSILSRGICICGNSIKKDSVEYRHILKEIENLSENNLYDDIRRFKYELEAENKNNYININEFNRKHKERKKLQKNIELGKARVEEIRKEIKNKENMFQYENQREDYRKKIENLDEKIGNLKEQKGKLEKNKENLEQKQAKLISKSEHNKKIEEYIAYANSLLEWIKECQKSKEVEIKNRLEEKVNDIFNKIYSGERKVKIDDKYRVSLITKILDKEYDTGKSEGLDRVKNFAFIGGLVSLAKEKIVTDDNTIDLSSEPYPLVMDAPFSNADENHTSQISKVLPDVAEQVIMFVMQKDYKYAESNLEKRIGKKYKLEKYSETKTSLIKI